eukprot:NODE_366_length_8705_cov_0.466070.p8 type:complete len:166 gc:universal NODE_366_length_8705_cov_0.466070:4418-4915(+)
MLLTLFTFAMNFESPDQLLDALSDNEMSAVCEQFMADNQDLHENNPILTGQTNFLTRKKVFGVFRETVAIKSIIWKQQFDVVCRYISNRELKVASYDAIMYVSLYFQNALKDTLDHSKNYAQVSQVKHLTEIVFEILKIASDYEPEQDQYKLQYRLNYFQNFVSV